jgi:hypothetical protein
MYIIYDIMYMEGPMSTEAAKRKNKHFVLDQGKLERARKVLGARTETETIERALEQVISEDERSRRAWAAHGRFLRDARRGGLQVRDVFGRADES